MGLFRVGCATKCHRLHFSCQATRTKNKASKMLYTPLFLQTRAIRSRKQAQKARRLAGSITTNDVARRLNRFADLLDGEATADELEAAAFEAHQELNDSS
jgi:hypothetical protein